MYNKNYSKDSLYIDFDRGYIGCKGSFLVENHTVDDKEALRKRKSAILEMVGFGKYDFMNINHILSFYLDGLISEEKFKKLMEREISALKQDSSSTETVIGKMGA